MLTAVWTDKSFSVRGIISSYGSAEEETKLELCTLTGGVESVFITTGTTSYVFNESLPECTYTLKVTKGGHAERTYTVNVADKAVTQDVKIHLLGDVDMNGKLNMLDIQKLFAFIKNASAIKDAYQKKLADVDENNTYSMLDIQRLFAGIKAT